jgi:sugar porter (SP) family MFS transporter
MNQLMISIGIKMSYISDFLIADDGDPFCWRMMLFVGVFPAIILLVGSFFLPESPRWLIGKGREVEGRRLLTRVEDPALIEESIAKIRADVACESESASYGELLKPWLRTAVMIALGFMIFQQATGINTIVYYAPKIYKMAGMESNAGAIWPAVIMGLVGFPFTIGSILLVDKIGRRPLYFIGLSGMVVALVCMGLSFHFRAVIGKNLEYVLLVEMCAYIASFTMSLGPLGWLIMSEVFPLKVRGAGMSMGSLVNWIANGIVAFTFLKLVRLITPAGAFWFYAGVGILALVWGYYSLPETKGVTLEKIEDHWRQRKGPREL